MPRDCQDEIKRRSCLLLRDGLNLFLDIGGSSPEID